jgi:hypothetical protein
MWYSDFIGQPGVGRVGPEAEPLRHVRLERFVAKTSALHSLFIFLRVIYRSRYLFYCSVRFWSALPTSSIVIALSLSTAVRIPS